MHTTAIRNWEFVREPKVRWHGGKDSPLLDIIVLLRKTVYFLQLCGVWDRYTPDQVRAICLTAYMCVRPCPRESENADA